MRPFKELTRRERLYRLRKLARKALEAYGLKEGHLGFIQYNENIIYRVDAINNIRVRSDNGPYIADRYVLRIHAMSDEQAVASELIWLAALNQEAGLPVPAPVMTSDGKLLARIASAGIPNKRVVSLLRWLDGRMLNKGLQPKHLNALGNVVAQLHTFSAQWQPPAGFDRPHWNWQAQLGGSMFEYGMDELVNSMPARFQKPFWDVSAKARQAMAALGEAPDAYGLIHSDLYPENVLYKAGHAYPIDFEDCGYGYWMWDIAVALCQWAWGKDWELMRDAFQDGYTCIRTLPDTQWAQLDLFVATQFATMLLWSSAFLKHDPKRMVEYETWREKNGNQLLGYFER